jgi:hypothetical protein
MAGAPSAAILRPLKPRSDHPPHYQDYDCANDCSNETRVLANSIPPDCLAKVCCSESSPDPEQGRHDKSRRLIFVSRMKEFRDHACHKSNTNGPKNAHWPLPLLCARTMRRQIMARLVNRNVDLNQTDEARRDACLVPSRPLTPGRGSLLQLLQGAASAASTPPAGARRRGRAASVAPPQHHCAVPRYGWKWNSVAEWNTGGFVNRPFGDGHHIARGGGSACSPDDAGKSPRPNQGDWSCKPFSCRCGGNRRRHRRALSAAPPLQ